MPGMIFISSAASRPWMASSVIICSFSVVVTAPVSVGTITSPDATTSISCLAVPTCNEILGMLRLPPCVRTIWRSSQVLNPSAEIVNV